MKPVGPTLFDAPPEAKAQPVDGGIRQGFLESSNIAPAHAMVEMMESMRAFEASQRVIHAIDETLSKGVNGGQG